MPRTKYQKTSDSYLALVQEFPLRRLRTAADHARAKALILRLGSERIDQGAAEYLDVLIGLTADFERRAGYAIDTTEISAADLLRHQMEERGESVSSVAREIGVAQSNLSEMLSGKRDWSKTAIRGLIRKFHIRAERFLR